MPDLGTYAFWILSAYGASAVLLGALVLWVWLRGARVRRALTEAEARQEGRHG
jgi:heme exporter protein D